MTREDSEDGERTQVVAAAVAAAVSYVSSCVVASLSGLCAVV